MPIIDADTCEKQQQLFSFESMGDQSIRVASDMATTYEGRGTRSRTESNATRFTEMANDENDSHLGTNNNSDDDDEHLGIDPCTPTIAPLHPSLTQMCLHSVEAEAEAADDSVPVEMKNLPMHRMRTASDLFEQARHFSSHSNPKLIQHICLDKIPGWNNLSPEDINVDQIMAGLSNQLFKVNIREDFPNRAFFSHPNVLFRIYGKDVNTLYDSGTEVQVFKKLGKRGVAPQLLAEFDGGRIEEWIEGSALLVTDMKKSTILAGAAAILAGIHQIDLSKVIDTTPCISKFLSRWRQNAMELYSSINEDHPSYLAIQRLNLPKLYEESFRLDSLLLPSGIPENPLTRFTFCHNDIQENNIMVTETVMRLIDFEYSGYSYGAFDIASYFWEMTCDYCVDSYPFFAIDPTRYPLIEKRRLFIAMYLSKYSRTTVKTSNHELLDPVLDSVERFQLACHMLWSFWSVIRAPQAATASSFDMLYYGQKRVDAYWSQKAKLIAQGVIPDDKGRWNLPNGVRCKTESTASSSSAAVFSSSSPSTILPSNSASPTPTTAAATVTVTDISAI